MKEDFLKTDEGKLLLVAGVLFVFGPAILKSLENAFVKKVSDVYDAAGNLITGAASDVVDISSGPAVYTGGGASYGDIVGTFGQSCADAIVGGNTVQTMIHCPWGWQTKLTALNAAKGGQTMQDARTLRREKDGVYR